MAQVETRNQLRFFGGLSQSSRDQTCVVKPVQMLSPLRKMVFSKQGVALIADNPDHPVEVASRNTIHHLEYFLILQLRDVLDLVAFWGSTEMINLRARSIFSHAEMASAMKASLRG